MPLSRKNPTRKRNWRQVLARRVRAGQLPAPKAVHHMPWFPRWILARLMGEE